MKDSHRSWPLVKLIAGRWCWATLGGGDYRPAPELERILLKALEEHMSDYERPEVLATYTEAELVDEATVCVCYAGCLP